MGWAGTVLRESCPAISSVCPGGDGLGLNENGSASLCVEKYPRISVPYPQAKQLGLKQEESHLEAYSKGGVAGFIRTAAVELAKYKININSVEPGNILTEGLDATGPGHIKCMIRAIPLGLLGTPEGVAHAILFLASKEEDFITGQSLIVDGGQTLPESHFSDY